jgi:hypothetical protein
VIVGAALNYHTFCWLKKTFVRKNVITSKRQKSVSMVENMPKMNRSKTSSQIMPVNTK